MPRTLDEYIEDLRIDKAIKDAKKQEKLAKISQKKAKLKKSKNKVITGDEVLDERLVGVRQDEVTFDVLSGTGEFDIVVPAELLPPAYGPPNYETTPLNPSELLVYAGMDPGAYIVTEFGLNAGATWLRDNPGEGAYTRVVPRARGKFISKEAIAELAPPSASLPKVYVRNVRPPSTKALPDRNGLVVLGVIPDIQVGYRRAAHNAELIPSHDEAAIDVARQIMEDLRPDKIVNVGDFCDLPMLGKYEVEASMSLTLQPSLDRAAQILAGFSATLGILPSSIIGESPENAYDADGKPRHVFLEGNHDLRLLSSLQARHISMFGIRQGQIIGDRVEDALPVVSMDNLLQLKRLGVHYEPGYPSSMHRFSDRLIAIHGDALNSAGSTAVKLLYKHTTQDSIIFGHVHRRETHTMTIGNDVRIERFAMTPGTLARVDGHVPSMKGSFDAYGNPVTAIENWQQGVGVITFDPKNPSIMFPETIAIQDGQAYYNGKRYEADRDRIAKELSYIPGMNKIQ